MSVIDASRDRYASLEFLAIYLDAEWGDVLFSTKPRPSDEQDFPTADPLQRNLGFFYRQIGRLTATWAGEVGIIPNRICDIGGSTGRMAHELGLRFSGATEILLAEPSNSFCEWACRILKGCEFDGWAPVPLHSGGRVDFRQIDSTCLPTPSDRVIIHNVPSNLIPRPPNYFDLITCLNVVDRVDQPVLIVNDILKLLKPGGMMVLASPLYFKEEFTPKDNWIANLQDLLDLSTWEIDGRIADVYYDFQYYNRYYLRFISQVMGVRKKPFNS